MCPTGCIVDPVTHSCKVCKRDLKSIMDQLQVPEADQKHTIDWLIYRMYQ